jgi:hypothetical protein
MKTSRRGFMASSLAALGAALTAPEHVLAAVTKPPFPLHTFLVRAGGDGDAPPMVMRMRDIKKGDMFWIVDENLNYAEGLTETAWMAEEAPSVTGYIDGYENWGVVGRPVDIRLRKEWKK